MAEKKLLRLNHVMQKTGMSRTGVYSGIKAGTFPAGIKIGDRCVAWDLTAIDKWIDSKISQGQTA